jgi:hypothetical protein
MKRAFVILALLAGVAHAAPPLTPPAGWEQDQMLAAQPGFHFGGAKTKLSVYAFRPPKQPTDAKVPVVLHVKSAEIELGADAERDRIATRELAVPRDSIPAGAKAEQDTQRADTAKKQLEAAVTWRDATIANAVRTLIATDGTRMVAVTGECVMALDAPADVAKACETALGTLDVDVPADKRVALAIEAVASEPPPSLPPAATMDDGGKLSLPPMRIDPPKPEPDRRPVYVGAGLLVFAALFWWNRKRREKFEREHDETPTEKPGKRDEDADSLHAAAEAGDDGDKK